MKKTNKKTKFKIKNPSMGLFILAFIVIILNYATIALFDNVRGTDMKKFASNRNRYSTTLTAKRGTIYDFNSNILAQNVSSYTVIAVLDSSATDDTNNPNHVVDKKNTAKLLAPLIDMSEEDILSLLNTEDVYQVELGPGGRGITELVKDEIEKLDLPGIIFEESYKRFYPNGDFASYIVGYAKTNETIDDNGNIKSTIDGELGIESLYDKELKGTDGYLEYEQDLNGYKLPDTKEIKKDAVDGYDIYLTIDSTIQRFVDDALKDVYDKYEPDWILFYVMDAKTGDILAGSSYPSFDPNERNLVNYENPLVSYEYEPGSVMKTFTYMCAIDKGTYNGSDTFLSGSIDVGDNNLIYDSNKSGWGTITFDDGYKYSSNVGITYMLQKFINRDELYECFKKYGFGSTTGIDLPREMTGSLNFVYDYETATAGFGQVIYTTPIQQLQGLTILTNNGKMLTPHVISKMVDSTGSIVYERKVEKSEQLVKNSTVTYMLNLMSDIYTNTSYRIDGFNIAAKTGTAEVYDSTLQKYVSGRNIYSYSAIYPADDPKLIIFTSAKFSNGGSHQATSTAFKQILKSIAKYYDYEDDTKTLNNYLLKSYISKKTKVVINSLKNDNINYIIIGNGDYIVNQYPNINTKVIENDRVFLLTNYTELTMPDMTGWSRKEVLEYSKLTGIDIAIDGTGYVYIQNIAAGKIITKDSKLSVALN